MWDYETLKRKCLFGYHGVVHKIWKQVVCLYLWCEEGSTENMIVTWSTALVYCRSLYLRFSIKYFNLGILLNPLASNFFIGSQAHLFWGAEKHSSQSQNDRQVRASLLAMQCPCTWSCPHTVVTDSWWQNRAQGGVLWLSLNHGCTRAARTASSKRSQSSGQCSEQCKHLQCCVPLPPGCWV